MGAALADDQPPDCNSTAHAWQSRSSKYVQSGLVLPALTAGPLKIRLTMSQCGSHVLDAAVQYTANGIMQASGFRYGERGCDASGMQTRIPESLVGIDVAYAGQDCLVQKQGF